MRNEGMVYLVGAGPGDPGLITVKGRQRIGEADVVIYDRLVNPELLAMAREDAELIYAGKSPYHHALSQEEINGLLVRKAREGKIVTRLKGGDPFVFGRGGEEAEAMAQANIPFEVVPGVTSAIAVPAYAGIPLTHRDYSSAFIVAAGREAPSKETPNINWAGLTTAVDTIVFLMGVEKLEFIVAKLLEHGRPPDTPAAVIHWGTVARQRVVTGNLHDIVERTQEAGIKPPAVIVIGRVVALRERLRWFDAKPLFGKRVLVTRSREQVSALSVRLRELGAEPVEFPTIKIAPPEDLEPLDEAIQCLSSYTWVIFTSVNGAKSFIQRLRAKGHDARALAGVKLAAIGPATAGELERLCLVVDYMPRQYIAEAIAEGLGDIAGTKILLPRSNLARPALARKLREKEAMVDEVVAYRTLPVKPTESIRNTLLEGRMDMVTFTSSSTVHNLAVALRAEAGDEWRSLLKGATVACIGPVTAQAAEELSLKVDIVAEEHTIEGLVKAMLRFASER